MLLVLTFPVAILVTVFAPDLIRLCFGPAYLDAARVLQVLVWGLPIRGAQGLLASQLAVMDRQSGIAGARAIGTVALFVSVPLFIWRFGFVGAAWALLLCDMLQFCLHCALLRARQAQPPLAKAVLIPAAAAALTAVASVAFKGLQPTLYLLLVVLVVVAATFATGAVRIHDVRFLRALLSKKAG
jgi:O-antigen/teichoic acid export membrane protein